MIPFPNVIAGILISIGNKSWLARFLVPFIWGIVYCFYLFKLKREQIYNYVELSKTHNRPAKWGMSHLQAFYFIEYMTALSTSLVFSIISGVIIDFF